MRYPILLTIIFIIALPEMLFAQACTTLGQTPSTAFPVCATTAFEQKSVPVCSTNSLYVPGCSDRAGAANYENRNPFWYKFTCYQSGSLGFTIKPKNQEDDYDWQLYDITGLNPNEVFTNRNIVVSGNWAATPGNTGTAVNGAPYINCASFPADNEPTFARMPNLIEGHDYILLVSHYNGDSQSGYDLTFSGGTAVITDPNLPLLKSLSYPCDATRIFVKTNKRILQNSIAADGSDFILAGTGINVISAQPGATGFDADSIILTLDAPLPPGTYDVIMQEGSDGSTLIDNCGNYIPEGDRLSLEIIPLLPTPMDSLVPPECAAGELHLIFGKKINSQSVSADASDFIINGPVPVTIQNIRFNNDKDNLSPSVIIELAEPLVHGGIYSITLKPGNDGNTVIDECGLESDPAVISFTIKDTVNADFTYALTRGCDKTSIQFQHDGRHDVNLWSWQLDYNGTSNNQNPKTDFAPPHGDKNISLTVSNGFCSDSVSKVIALDPPLLAAFETNSIICPEDSAQFINHSTGNIIAYSWSFGDGSNNFDETPSPRMYPQPLKDKEYQVQLTVTSDLGCVSTASHTIRVLMTCRVDVPNAFTPNYDGINDYFYPLNAFLADNLIFRVYNRYGQMVFESTDWQQKWDGTFKGTPQGAGEYAWTLQYVNRVSGESVFKKGSVALIR